LENNKVITVVAMIMVILFSGLSFGVYDQAFAQVKDPNLTSDDSLRNTFPPNHSEVGDAGNLPGTAQDPGGVGPLTSIVGSAGGGDEDMYRICITNPSAFSATTLQMASFDTQLFLFDSTGRGVYSNDDVGLTLESLLPPGHPNSPTAVGIYFLAINSWDNEAQNAGGLIFGNVLFTDVNGPTGPGGANPITSWDGNVLSGGGLYAIVLTGAAATSSCAPAVGGTMIPLDTTALLLAGAQMNAAWMIPVIAAGIVIGVFVIKRRK